MIKISKINLVFIISLNLAACAGFFGETPVVDQRSSKAKGEKIENIESPVIIEQSSTKQDLSPKEPEYGVEIIWDIPNENVDGYVVYSGEQKDIYDSELHLRVKDLKVTDQGQYSYILAPVDPDKPIYIAIAAKNGESISEKSTVQEFTAKAKFQ